MVSVCLGEDRGCCNGKALIVSLFNTRIRYEFGVFSGRDIGDKMIAIYIDVLEHGQGRGCMCSDGLFIAFMDGAMHGF